VAALLALLSSLLWGSADFLGGTLTRRLPSPVVVGLSQLAGLVAVAGAAALAGELGGDTGYLPWAVLAGLGGMVGLLAFYAALATGTMGVVSPIAALGVVIPVLVGLGRGERPSLVTGAGILLAVAGVVLASGPELSGRAGVRPVLLAGVAAVGFGLALLFLAEGSRTSTLMTLVGMRVTSVSVLGLALVTVLLRSRGAVAGMPARVRPLVPLLLLTGLGDAAANLTFGLASTRGLVSVVAVLGSLYPVVTVLLARVIHHERMATVQAVGVTGALSGVVLIAAG
jgi:drug/metabolite transporter (DMT)-like permease